MSLIYNTILLAVNLLSQKALPPLHLGTFKIRRKFYDDIRNKVRNGCISCHIYDNSDLVGEFDYKIKTGQVGGFFMAEKYRRQALEQQMLIYMMKDMQDAGAKNIWEVVPNDAACGRIFYSKLWSFAYKASHIHPSVTGGGYIMDIPMDLRSLAIIPGVGVYDT
jgi:hypothetical protein